MTDKPEQVQPELGGSMILDERHLDALAIDEESGVGESMWPIEIKFGGGLTLMMSARYADKLYATLGHALLDRDAVTDEERA